MPWKRASRLLLLRCMLNITNDPQRPREAKLNGGSLESTDIHACFCITGPILSMLGEHRAHVLIFGSLFVAQLAHLLLRRHNVHGMQEAIHVQSSVLPIATVHEKLKVVAVQNGRAQDARQALEIVGRDRLPASCEFLEYQAQAHQIACNREALHEERNELPEL